MANTYDVGDLVRCTVAFVDASGDPADPATVTFKYEDPSGNETTLVYVVDAAVVRTGTGAYRVDVTVTTNGNGAWYYRFEGTGTNISAGESHFFVRESEF